MSEVPGRSPSPDEVREAVAKALVATQYDSFIQVKAANVVRSLREQGYVIAPARTSS